MKNIFIVLVAILILSLTLKAQIHSTLVGGEWNNVNTWIEGIIPGSGNDVIIQGPVVQHSVSGYNISSEYCNNLTITSSGSLRNGDYGGGAGTFPVIVGGNIVNDGTVANGPSDYLKIVISGDLENNNIWMPYETEFQTSSNHNLSLGVGKSFGSKIINNGSPSFTALTDMLFTCDFTSNGNLYRDHFYLNGQIFNVGDHSIEMQQCLINKGTLLGDFEILGTFTVGWADGYDIRDTLVFEGNITVTDTLSGNIYGGGYGIYKLKVVGNIINNGVIKDDYDIDNPLNNDDLNLLITGNITNNGKWDCNYTTLIGNSTQSIYQADNKQFDTYYTVLNSSDIITALSDITITKDFNLNGSILDMQDNVLAINGWLYNGTITNTKLQNGFLQNINSLNTLRITGKVSVDIGNVFQNTVIVEDTLQSNEYGGGSTVFTLPILGDITNYGVIKNINNGDMLSLEVSGNINNNGVWQNSFTKFSGTQDQNIEQTNGKKFTTDFIDLDSLSEVIAISNLKIEGNFNINHSNLQMNNHEIDINGNLHGGNILSSKIKNATISNLNAYDSIETRGVVVIDDGNYFYGNLVVTDTLQSQVYGGGAHTYVLKIFGYVINYGLIRNEPAQNENLALQIQGSIMNKGEWTNYRTYQLFYPNDSLNSVICFNTGTTNCIFNGSSITGSGANSFSIFTGGGVQTVAPNESYDLSVEFNPTGGDTTAVLNIECDEIGTLNSIYLLGHNYNTTVDVKDETQDLAPTEFTLYQNYPNPFNPSTKISWQSPVGGWQTLKVYDILGNEVATLADEYKPAGSYEVEFQFAVGNRQLASGIYFYHLKSGSFFQTKKMILIK